MKNPEGVIFDFNGTLFWDSKYHEKAWRRFALDFLDINISDAQFKEFIHGRINRDILNWLFNTTLTIDEVQHYSGLKENMYRQLLAEDKNNVKLAPGATDIFIYLKKKNIPFTIATSAEFSNVDYYFKNLSLSEWFDFSKIVFDNGSILPKPAPDFFIKAAHNLNLSPEKCLVVEDSVTGISAARNAKCCVIIFIKNEDPVDLLKINDFVDGTINNLFELSNYI